MDNKKDKDSVKTKDKEREKEIPLNGRDVTWLSFNYRVLQEAMDISNPLFERLKFLAIYSNNLDEFFRVRVSNHRNLVRVGKKTKKKLDYDPEVALNTILKIVNKQQEEFSDIFENHIKPELELQDINMLHYSELDEEQMDFVETYFQDNMLPFVQPVLLVKNKIRPFLNNAALYLALILRDKESKKESNVQYGLIKVPSDHLPRFIQLPSHGDQYDLIMLDDIVRYSASWLFPGYDIIDSFSVKLTRDAELYIEDEFEGDLISKIQKSLGKRSVGPASRFVYDREMSKELQSYLVSTLELDDTDLLPEGRYHNNFDFFSFPDFGKKEHKNEPLPPMPYSPLEDVKDFFGAMRKKDHMIHVPYQSYQSVIRFFEQTVKDSKVTHIKIVQYRVAKDSRIMEALIKACKAGKHVTVFIEVKARFDEAANLSWGKKLEKAGAKVHYSFPGLKVHCKLAMISRRERGKLKQYTYLSTGNFHEDTAKVYSDFGVFTTDERITKEVARVFSYLETVKTPKTKFKHLLVGQFNLRPDIEALINAEIKLAKKGKPASIFLKMNSLQDKRMIQKLYEASQAGVKIRMVIRGICCLVPGLKKISENIEVISIVDRFLEHARVFVFGNQGDELVYFSSADFMTRNLSHRIEVAFPIYDKKIKKTVLELLEIQWNDNLKARIIDKKGSNSYKEALDDAPNRSQTQTYFFLKRQSL